MLAVPLLLSVSASTVALESEPIKKPNVVLIITDDLGYTDLSAFGGEINTPNIDLIGQEGIQFSEFYTSVSSSPTRSMLLTGTDNHIAGLGNMQELLTEAQKGKPGYEGYLSKDTASLPEVLSDNGYKTYMSGKWHLGSEAGQYPADRGFDRSFSMLYGGASHWHDKSGLLANVQEEAKYVRDHDVVEELPKDFYSSRSFTDELIDYIRDGQGDEQPFFAYLAFTAPHDPLHAPEPWLSQYKGEYDEGYEVLKQKRILGAKNKGIVHQDAPEIKSDPNVTPWKTLSDEQKEIEIKAMETYAGMVSNVDYQVGRLQSFLKDINEYDNTIFIFLSDNGANAWFTEDYPGNRGSSYIASFDNSAENIGHPNSHYAYGVGWASASNGPLNLYKLTAGEGGIRTPLLISGPGVKPQNTSSTVNYVTDIMPTLLDLTGSKHPASNGDKSVKSMLGKSMRTELEGEVNTVHRNGIIAGEMGGKNGWIRDGDYKARFVDNQYSDGEWQLFNVATDPGETKNLAQEMNEKLNTLIEEWQNYSDSVGVIN